MSGTVLVHSKVFPIQSYFDNALAQTAVLAPTMSDPIIKKQVEPNVKASFIGLHPSSQCPIAFRALPPKVQGGKAPTVGRHTPTFVLVPGQFMRLPAMEGFAWGLPAGWLGGGVATLFVADDPDTYSGWNTQRAEVLIQRVRLQIQADAAPSGVTFVKAWPNRFPWPSSLPLVAVEPTRVTFRLRLNNLAGQSDMRILFKSNDELDIGSDGLTPGATDVTNIDVSWPPAIANILAVAFPVVEITPPKIGGDVALVALTDLTVGAPLAGAYVDIARYGRI